MHDDENFKYITIDEIIELTPLENEMLKLLIKNKDRITTYEQIINEIYFETYDPKDIEQRRKIFLGILRLKRKIKNEIEIINKKHIGFMIESFEERNL